MFGVFVEKCTFCSENEIAKVDTNEHRTFYIDLDSGRYDLFSHPQWREIEFNGTLYELQEMVIMSKFLILPSSLM